MTKLNHSIDGLTFKPENILHIATLTGENKI